MATVNATLFFKNNRTYGVGAINFDLIIDENHNFVNQVTRYKIEDGSDITDHIQNELQTGSCTGLITNFSLFENGILNNRAQDAFDRIERLWRTRELVDIVTVFKVYSQVAITNISIARDDSSGEELVASFGFQEVNIVSLEQLQIEASIKLNDLTSDQNKQSSPEIDVGKTTEVQNNGFDIPLEVGT